MVQDSEEFCYRMGYPVKEELYCYNGVPTASIIKMNEEKRAWNSKHPENVATIKWGFSKVFMFFGRNTAIIGEYIFYMTLILIVVFILYEFNRH